ncbi:beta-amylase 1, chloroplastic [Cryptomeria japonica]|uniref:beta-amylase 1, chloroplastic n=1 Tax=Cryptomeria japonica TaxID=3369 RepID=UPI0027DA234E|nr:beta-amylase 1, chloroplastic [Cryptomeria japonica]
MGNAPSDGTTAESENSSSHRRADSEAYPITITGVPNEVKEKILSVTSSCKNETRGVPVFVMLPLDIVTHMNTVHKPERTMENLKALKSIGVEGVMMDVWWGIVEKEAPGHYNWTAYRELIEMIRNYGLKVQTVMSFHQCGGNVGDSVNIALPKWVVEEMHKDKDLAYTDHWGRRNYEYVSLGSDSLPALRGRTPVQCYADFMRSFKENFNDLLGETIAEVHVGMGPAGELRYPSYPEANGTWKFPGIGAFQCYDKYMLSSLKARAVAAGNEIWGHPTSNAGHYNDWPEDTQFFKSEGGDWNSPYGQFFLKWYSDMLLHHGDIILATAVPVFSNTGAKIAAKVSGIHWHYGTRSHAPELTAGYYNTRFNDGYLPIAHMFFRHGAIFNFTCLEMRDSDNPHNIKCSPEKLVKQVIVATRKTGVAMGGENALPRFDDAAYRQIIKNSSMKPLCGFTYLRMKDSLFHGGNWSRFTSFVRKMSEIASAVDSRDEEYTDAKLNHQ